MNRVAKGILLLTVIVLLIFSLGSASLAQEAREGIVQFGGDVVISAEEIIYGDVVSFKGDVTVQGQVHGDVVSFLGNVTLSENALVTGDVVVFKGEVLKQDTTVIGGKIVAGENLDEFKILERDSGAGDTSIPNLPVVKRDYRDHGTTTFFSSVLQLLGLLGLAALGASIFPRHLNTMSLELTKDILRTFLIGLAAWIIYPFTMLVLVITIIGIPVALIMGLLIPVIFLLGALVTAVALGSARLRPMLSNTFSWAKEPNLLIEGMLGIFVLWLVSKAPIIGWLVVPLIAIFGLGIILTTKFGTNKPWFARKEKQEKQPVETKFLQSTDDGIVDKGHDGEISYNVEEAKSGEEENSENK
ncbi:polymer-forming cytoskeletal protein [Desulfitibacter alkalitolerans]|uniref:polymer-forming cytoskeletal protein n=1 Tax=Desulfitibacter alkalitolerans TaxID=264641 RepID=UPI000483F0E8|nr:polymer-forming cytoskeletal protein [Desulfitibacter alkalitolerans]